MNTFPETDTSPNRVPARNYEILPKPAPAGGDLDGELLEVAMGPHHPSTHGVFRMDVVLDGETVVKLKPVFDCFHRNPKNNWERNPERQALAKDWPLNHERR